jgi:hypothetical protein
VDEERVWTGQGRLRARTRVARPHQTMLASEWGGGAAAVRRKQVILFTASIELPQQLRVILPKAQIK